MLALEAQVSTEKLLHKKNQKLKKTLDPGSIRHMSIHRLKRPELNRVTGASRRGKVK